MLTIPLKSVDHWLTQTQFPDEIMIEDTFGWFDENYKNKLLDHISQNVNQTTTIWTEQVIDGQILHNYPKFIFKTNPPKWLLDSFYEYRQHPPIEYKNFICSFNGTPHVSRKLLVACLHKFGFFNPDYSSKNFTMDRDVISGHIMDYVGNRDNFYNKFFLGDQSDSFFNEIYSFGHLRYDHNKNIYNLEKPLTQSFVHVVSECMATKYHPFVSEKFLFSIITRGLFLTYGQPRWHEHLEKYYGFKKYTKLFDYRFDRIFNAVKPIDRKSVV